MVSRMNQKVRRKWGLSARHDLKPNITTESTFLERPGPVSPLARRRRRGAGLAATRGMNRGSCRYVGHGLLPGCRNGPGPVEH